ncbi:MAG: DEAD/DEAH box helicase, partial [Anaerolineae bacterium]
MDPFLAAFLPATRHWFQRRYREPTRAQSLGWPPIQRGENILILSPTGSGKTLAAFLWGIDRIYSALAHNPDLSGVQLLYVSPLKALNNDIARNVEEPLKGIRRTAVELGKPLPEIETAVRTGDTPAAVRQRMLRHPPHILITTPESLFLLLTSPLARQLLTTVQSVIVDEIHTLCGNKRGVHLGLTLERLEVLTGRPIQRIGLSATQRPLEEVARFVGGQTWQVGEGGERVLTPRPVTIVDAGVQKPMDLRLITPVPDLHRLPGGSVWPSLIPRVLEEILRHSTTLVFANSRRGAERAADRLNEQYARESEEEVPPGSPEALLVDGVPKGQGMMGTGRVGGPFRAHHGSVSRAVRLELEQALKAGELAALVATSSLELGIDIGSVGAVLQLQSPRGIARGLQRIGRSGHLVGQTSYGRIFVTHREDLLDAAAVAHGMLQGDIEPTRTPRNCLDILAQQIVAMVAVEPLAVDTVFDTVRQAYGYEQLSREALLAVLKMISGGYDSDAYRGLRPCIEWDRVNNTLLPLPGTRLLAIRNGGTIPDRGEFRVVLPDGRTSLGTLDEEFVFETRVGDVFALGSNTWRVMSIDEDRMVVADAAGSTPRMPFWHGELPKREYHMGLRLGAFRRLLAERAAELEWAPEDPGGLWPSEAIPIFEWLGREYAMDEASARNAVSYVRQQLDHAGAISTDRTIVLERFADALGDQRLVIHSCFGARVNSVWAIALTHAFRERLGTTVEVQVNDDAILFRLVEGDREPPLDLIRTMGAEEARERVLQELPNSALFGAQFRMNAARALILPRVRGAGRRTPFWLQRLRAKDLLAIARGWDDFPLVAETYRDCLRDVLDVEHLGEVLGRLADGEIRIVETETLIPSPVAAGLLFEFAAIHLYDNDAPKLERQIQALSINRELLAELLDDGSLADLLRPEVIERVESELQHLADGYQARTTDELAVILRELGDLSSAEIQERTIGDGLAWIEQLEREGRAVRVTLGDCGERWISAEHYPRYRDAFAV